MDALLDRIQSDITAYLLSPKSRKLQHLSLGESVMISRSDDGGFILYAAFGEERFPLTNHRTVEDLVEKVMRTYVEPALRRMEPGDMAVGKATSKGKVMLSSTSFYYPVPDAPVLLQDVGLVKSLQRNPDGSVRKTLVWHVLTDGKCVSFPFLSFVKHHKKLNSARSGR